jgi:hypothetical protein
MRRCEYWPYPYRVIENCKGNPNGLGLENQGKEHTIEELGEYDESLVKKVSDVPESQVHDRDLSLNIVVPACLDQPSDRREGVPCSQHLCTEAVPSLKPDRRREGRRGCGRNPQIPRQHPAACLETTIHHDGASGGR